MHWRNLSHPQLAFRHWDCRHNFMLIVDVGSDWPRYGNGDVEHYVGGKLSSLERGFQEDAAVGSVCGEVRVQPVLSDSCWRVPSDDGQRSSPLRIVHKVFDRQRENLPAESWGYRPLETLYWKGLLAAEQS